MYAHFGHLKMVDTIMVGNTAQRHGGGLYMGTRATNAPMSLSQVMALSPWDDKNPPTLDLYNCTIKQAKASGNGGMLAKQWHRMSE